MKKEVYVALLRGVNVGGNNKLPMKSLAELCEAQGCDSVKTYIQSGNVIFSAGPKTAAGFAKKLKSQIHAEFRFETTVILRTFEELRAVVANNPFPKVDTKFLHVNFLAEAPNVGDAVKLDPPCVDDEAFSLRGKEIFMYLPYGAGRSKMAAYAFDKVLRTVGSARNWNTVNALLGLAEEARQSE